jgi:cell division protease FtsH
VLWYLLVFFGLLYLLYQGVPISSAPKEIAYSEFYDRIEKQGKPGEKSQIKSVQIGKDYIRWSERGASNETLNFRTVAPVGEDRDLGPLLRTQGIEYSNTQENRFLPTVITWVLPILLIAAIWIIFIRQMRRTDTTVMSFGKSRAKITAEKDIKTTFDDVAGCDEAKEELKEIIEFLKNPKKFQVLGGKIPKGVLLVGPPGTGKTLIARAIAGEAGVPFFSISGSDFVEMFVGVGAARVRDLFNQAKSKAPCIVFIDEIDAVGRQRFAGIGGGHDEREQTLNQLLVEMDGFESQKGVIILAATNRPDVLDPALLRPGRFDRRIVVDSPDLKGRLEILKVHTKGKPLAEDVDLERVARRTPGFSGADLANAVNEAALLAARRDKSRIDMQDMEDALDRVVAGPERKSLVLSEKQKEHTAYHEAGHALVATLCEHADPVHKVTIIPRGPALGYTMQLPNEDRYSMTREELLDRITVLMGGRAAEELVFSMLSTGAQNDLERSTALARNMVCSYGMSDQIGPVSFGDSQREIFLGRDFNRETPLSEKTHQEIDAEVTRIIRDCYGRARKILEDHRAGLAAVAEELKRRETITGEEMKALLTPGAAPVVPPPSSPAGPPANRPLAPAVPPEPEAPPTTRGPQAGYAPA